MREQAGIEAAEDILTAGGKRGRAVAAAPLASWLKLVAQCELHDA